MVSLTTFDGLSTGLKTADIVAALLTADTQRLDKVKAKLAASQTAVSDFQSLDEYVASTESLFMKASLATNRDALVSSLNTFVDTYNKQLTKDAGNRDAKQLLTKFKLDVSTAGTSRLSSLGITTNRDGSLSFDETTARNAIATDEQFSNAKQLMSDLFDKAMATSPEPYIQSKLDMLKVQISNITDQISTKETQIARKKELLTMKYAQVEMYASTNANSLGSLFNTTS